MSKGSKIVQFRLPPKLEREVLETIERRNQNTRREPWDRTGFLLNAIREKIDKMARGRDPKYRRKRGRSRE